MNKPSSKFIMYTSFIIVLALIFIYLFTSRKEKELRFPDVVSSPDMNSMVESGQTLHIELNEKRLAKRDSVIISYDNKRVNPANFKYELNTQNLSLGYQKVTISVYTGSKVKVIDLPFFITSDITPIPLNFTKLANIPHDSKSYTQGFEISGGMLYESAGQYNESTIRKLNYKTGKIIKSVLLAGEYFAEGLTIMQGKVYQLTWKEATCFIYDQDLNLVKKTSFRSTNGEGWGICNDGKSLIISDGSNKLTYLNPETLAVEKIISVYAGDNEVQYLNELEYVNGFIYANVYTTNQIVKIDATSGKVMGVSDFSALKNENQDGEVLNGIAYNPVSGTFLITGKYWKSMYEVRM